MEYIELSGNGGTSRCIIQPGKMHWRVECTPASRERMAGWNDDPVIKGLLKVLQNIPNILVPRSLPSTDAEYYLARPPAGKGTWFRADELESMESLETHDQMTVMDLWKIAADLCQTLEQLYSLGIWGYAGRDRILLRKKEDQLGYCLTDITDCKIYRYPQAFSVPSIRETKEDPVTLAMRLLIGSVALCADRQQLLDGGETDLEVQLGTACAKGPSRLFRQPSRLQPLEFLERARTELRRAARSMRWDTPKKLRLYLVLLGPDCRQAAVPALSCVARSFYHCAGGLAGGNDVQADITCIYPWDRVRTCRFEKNCVCGLSALDQGQARRPVPLGGLLDCLSRELERDQAQGIALLVCYITLPGLGGGSAPALNCMDDVLIQELARKRGLKLFDAFLCSADLRQWADTQYSGLVEGGRNISLEKLDRKMYSAVGELLKRQRYFYPGPSSLE